MALTGVKISEETYLTCFTHALTTETEEIMGLLLGDIEYLEDGTAMALVWWAAPQTRSDRRKDRVETNPEQLAAASAQAEGMYQMLDPGFVGLIFSCFSEDSNKVGKVQVIAFQSQDRQHRDAPRFWSQGGHSSGLETGRAAAVTPISNTHDGEIAGGVATGKVTTGPSPSKTQNSALENLFAIADSEARDTPGATNAEDDSLSMQEAMHLSTLEASGAEFVRKEIQLEIVPSHSLVKLSSPLSPLVELQKILFQEEQTAFRHAISQSTVNGKIHPLAVLHHEAQYQATLAKLMEYCLCPAISCLTDKVQQNRIRFVHIQEDAQAFQLQQLGARASTTAVPTSISRRSQRNVSSASAGRSSEVFNPSARSTPQRGLPEGKPSSDPKDLIRF